MSGVKLIRERSSECGLKDVVVNAIADILCYATSLKDLRKVHYFRVETAVYTFYKALKQPLKLSLYQA